MHNEIDILDLHNTFDKQIASLTNYEKMIKKFQKTVQNLQKLEEKKIIEIENFNSFVNTFYDKDCMYREFANKLIMGVEKEKLEAEQIVNLYMQNNTNMERLLKSFASSKVI